MTKRILVTGGAGFIGSHLVDALVAQGHRVDVIDNLEPQVHKEKPDYLNPKAHYAFKDVRDPDLFDGAFADVEVVVHLAAMVGVGQSMYQVTRYVDANVGGTARLLQALVEGKHGVKKLLVASSMSIYGEGAYTCPTDCGTSLAPVATPETKPLQTNSVYAVTKRDQEELCLITGRAYGIPTVALRFFNVYGPRQSLDNPYTGVAAIFQSRIKNGQPPVVFEDGHQSRDFVSVHDVVRSCLLAIEGGSADYRAVNVGTGTATSILDVAQVLLRLYRSPLRPSIENRFRAGDVRHCFADISLARRLLGYEPAISFGDGMRELVEWGQKTSARDGFTQAYDELNKKGLLEG